MRKPPAMFRLKYAPKIILSTKDSNSFANLKFTSMSSIKVSNNEAAAPRSAYFHSERNSVMVVSRLAFLT